MMHRHTHCGVSHWRVRHRGMSHVVRRRTWRRTAWGVQVMRGRTGAHHVMRRVMLAVVTVSVMTRAWRWCSMPPTGCRWRGVNSTGLWWRSVFTFPSIIGCLHGKLSASVILDLASFVDQSLRSHVIQTINALALVSTHDACLETLNRRRGACEGGVDKTN